MTKHIKLKKNKADLMNTFLTIQPPYFKSSPLKMFKDLRSLFAGKDENLTTSSCRQ